MRLRPSTGSEGDVPAMASKVERRSMFCAKKGDSKSWRAWPDDDEGDPDVSVVCCELARRQAVLTHVVAVVGTEHQVGVAQCADRSQCGHDGPDHVVYRLHIFRPETEVLRDLGQLEAVRCSAP